MTTESVDFRVDDITPVLARIEALDRLGTGDGWINLTPALPAEVAVALQPASGLAGWFSGRGPAVPVVTWTPPSRGTRPRPASVGISHGAGPSALDRLREGGLSLPQEWTKKQDHAKHGIVAEVPESVDAAAMVTWLLRAAIELSLADLAGVEWVAEVHSPR